MKSGGWKCIGGLLILAVLAAFIGVGACEREGAPPAHSKPPAPLKKLTVLTPHSEKIRNAFAAGFSSWCLSNRGERVHIAWLNQGTPQCVEYVKAIPEMHAQRAAYENPDVMFGGGISDHTQLAELGFSRPIELAEVLEKLPAQVNGVPTRDPEGHWVASGLSSFGILYNAQGCQQRDIAAPTNWADLAEPRFQGWIGLANPLASGSNRECLVLILQQQGWQAGWGSIIRILANARALGQRSGEVLNQVESGVFLAVLAVNFDGMSRAAESGGALAYVDPPNGTVMTPDVVSILSMAADVELARDFVGYVLSENGQALWGVAKEHRQSRGGTLYHYPIDPEIYGKYAGKLCVPHNPFEQDFGLRLDAEKVSRQGELIKLLVNAACGENHIQLQQAWGAVIAAGMPEAAVNELTAPLFDEQTALELADQYAQASPAEVAEMVDELSGQFAEKYAKVLQLTGE
ncbi:MAG: ABC transporter substrate-binding protein [Planctomycetota bacterium]